MTQLDAIEPNVVEPKAVEITSDFDKAFVTGTFSISGKVSPEKGSTESKSFTLRFKLDRVSVIDVVSVALSNRKIAWANSNRPKYTSIKDKGVYNLRFDVPTERALTPDEEIAKLVISFMKAGLDETTAKELATKAVLNPTILS